MKKKKKKRRVDILKTQQKTTLKQKNVALKK